MRFWDFTTNIFRSSKPLKRTKKQQCVQTMSKQQKDPVLWFSYPHP